MASGSRTTAKPGTNWEGKSLKKLTAKQDRFVSEYLIDLNATQAAIRAGYAEKGAAVEGSRLLATPKVSAAVAAAKARRAERTEITQDYVLTSIRETMERCKQAEPVTYQSGDPVMTNTPDGEIARAYKFNAGGVLRGAELLGRHLKIWDVKPGSDEDNPLHAVIEWRAVKAGDR